MAEKKTMMQDMLQGALDAQSAAERDRQAREQAKFDKAFEDVRSGKIQPPRNDDMGPLPKPEPKKEAAKPVKKMAKGGSVSSASKRADGCATKGKTKGRIV